jgi:hypothetical protein
VKLGRVAENDVVVHDASVSRRHARIQLKEGAYLIEDLGSTRGTQVNNQPVKVPRPLANGDVVLLGDVIFNVAIDGPDLQGATRLIDPLSARAPAPTHAPAPALEPEPEHTPTGLDAQAIEAAPPAGQATVVNMSVLATPEDGKPKAEKDTDTDVNPVARRPSKPLPQLQEDVADASTNLKPALAARAGKSVQPAAEAKAGAPQPVLSRAEQARQRRQAMGTLGGRAQLFWSGLSQGARLGVYIGGGVVGLGIVGGIIAALSGPDTAAKGPEPKVLSSKIIKDSFGYGEEVSWNRPDQKLFSFNLATPTRAVGLVHYQARDISDGEVVVTLNGAEVGRVPADTPDAIEREIVLLLSPKLLKRNASNDVVFDNVRNPPNKEPWRIWNLWLEVIPLPELSDDEALEQANDFIKQGKKFYDLRDVGSENLFKSWRAYRSAWISLEGLERKPEAYDLVRVQMANAGKMLDQQCAKMMLGVERALQFKDRKKARQTLDDIGRYFPTTEHRCHNLALQTAADNEL